ncbi:MAG: LysR substrate-binding domain-containing protein [Hyphomicrobiaceae bacterium]
MNSIKAFEASARRGGFVAAARELGVSAAAVSLQVKNLESHLGVELFTRKSNGVALTEIGEAVFRQCTDALGALADIPERITERRTPARLVISAMPSPAIRWLNRAVSAFLRNSPDLRLEIREEADPVNFQRDDIDVRIAYGAHIYNDYWVRDLLTDEVGPMCTPQIARLLNLTDDSTDPLPESMLIHPHWGPSFAFYPTWNDWFAHAGRPQRARLGAGHSIGMTCSAVDLALDGVGIALGQRFLAARELAAGQLVMPCGHALKLPHAYALVVPRPRIEKDSVRRFLDWVSEDVGTRLFPLSIRASETADDSFMS